MNVRALIRLREYSLKIDDVKHADNPYIYKIDVWHGDDIHPYHESASFTKEELEDWLYNVNKLCEKIHGELIDGEKDRKL